jgi:protoporphyrinogen oxidase
VLEAEAGVGGVARTEVRDGFRFDLGGHRFFTRSPQVERLWHEVLGEELLLHRRLSRIYYRGRFLNYPLDARDVVRKVGPLELTRALGSYLAAAALPHRPEETFEQWMCNRFGRRLYEMFFAAYTEKVGGSAATSCEPSGRPRGSVACRSPRRHGRRCLAARTGRSAASSSAFTIPAGDPARCGRRCAARHGPAGAEVHTHAPVTQISIADRRVAEVTAGGRAFEVDHVISSIPLPSIARIARPAPDRTVLAAAAGLRHREFLTVALVLDGPEAFPDNWLYIHEPAARVARIQNFRAWSPWMVPDEARSCLGLEYFCFAGDHIWSMSDRRPGGAGSRRTRTHRARRPGPRGKGLRRQGSQGLSDL